MDALERRVELGEDLNEPPALGPCLVDLIDPIGDLRLDIGRHRAFQPRTERLKLRYAESAGTLSGIHWLGRERLQAGSTVRRWISRSSVSVMSVRAVPSGS